VCSTEKRSQVRAIEKNVLEYLLRNPDARDTLEGIVEWWLLEREIRRRTEQVKEAINTLVDEGLLLKQQSADSRTHFTINTERSREAEAFLRCQGCEDGEKGEG